MDEGADDRQSSMVFIKPGPEDIRGNAAIARLAFLCSLSLSGKPASD